MPNLHIVSQANCSDTIAPSVCRLFYNIPSFSVLGILRYIIAVILFVMVLLVCFQIVKIVFSWIGHSHDEKARPSAFKAIFNTVLAAFVLLVMLFLGMIVMDYLGIDLTQYRFR